jgi:hypothetical protein
LRHYFFVLILGTFGAIAVKASKASSDNSAFTSALTETGRSIRRRREFAFNARSEIEEAEERNLDGERFLNVATKMVASCSMRRPLY